MGRGGLVLARRGPPLLGREELARDGSSRWLGFAGDTGGRTRVREGIPGRRDLGRSPTPLRRKGTAAQGLCAAVFV
jgi:hypothetical protein